MKIKMKKKMKIVMEMTMEMRIICQEVWTWPMERKTTLEKLRLMKRKLMETKF